MGEKEATDWIDRGLRLAVTLPFAVLCWLNTNFSVSWELSSVILALPLFLFALLTWATREPAFEEDEP